VTVTSPQAEAQRSAADRMTASTARKANEPKRRRSAPRTGPIGRLARLLLVVVAALSLYSIADQGGPASFRDPSNLREPITWVLHAAMFTLFVVLAGQLAVARVGPAAVRRWQMRALVALAAVLAAATGAAWLAHGAVWATPLSDVVWGVDAVMLVQTIVALLLAIALGTPGCEVGVWPELIGRVRGIDTPTPTRPICVFGLYFIDDWEARQHARTTAERADHPRGSPPTSSGVD
jgi:hypothetical protein